MGNAQITSAAGPWASSVAAAIEEDDAGELAKLYEGVDPNVGMQYPSLFLASQKGSLACVEHLLSRDDIDPNLDGGFVPFGQSPIAGAISGKHVEVAKALANHPRIDLNKGPYNTPIKLAILYDCPEIVRTLAANEGCDLNFKFGSAPTPILRAMELERWDMVVDLLSNERLSLKGCGLPLIHRAFRFARTDPGLATRLVEAIAHSPAYFCNEVMKNDYDARKSPMSAPSTLAYVAATYCVSSGPKPESQGGDGELTEVLLADSSGVVPSSASKEVELLEILVKASGRELDTSQGRERPGRKKKGLIHYCAKKGRLDIVNALVQAGASVNPHRASERDGLTAVEVAEKNGHAALAAKLGEMEDTTAPSVKLSGQGAAGVVPVGSDGADDEER